MRSFTEDELLQEWRRRLGMLTQDCGCLVNRHDGADLDLLLRSRLRSWYASLLLHAPAGLLPQRDVAAEVRQGVNEDGWQRIEIPAPCGRVASLRLEGWLRSVTRIQPPGGAADEVSRFPGLEPTAELPLALGHGRLIWARPAGKLAELTMILPPADGTYALDESLLDSLPAEL